MDKREDTKLIRKEDSSFNVLKQWPIIVALATIAIGLVGILTISLVYGLKGGEYFDDYGVVMDAGSSKTNTIVYKWKSSKYRGTGQVSQEDNCLAEGGIAKMNPMHLEPVINCAKNVTSVIAPRSLTQTPLFFAATAGMRLLKITNASRVNEILEQLNLQLPETNLDVKAIEIISGKDEGIYGWITANFLLKTLNLPEKTESTGHSTYGALDMGGASMQIAYAVPESENSADVTSMQLYGQTYNVFSQSNLCFGRDEAQNRYQALLLLNRSDRIVEDPCVPKGFEKNVTGAKLFEPICANFTMDGISDLLNVTFTYVGTSDPKACKERVSQLLDDNLCKRLNFPRCFHKHKNLPDTQKFLAFASFVYTTQFLNATNVTLEKYESITRDFCSKTWEEVQTFTNNSYASQYCFNANYIYEVLINGFGFKNNTWKNLEFIAKISGKDVGWTLGYMINATNIIPEKATPRLISTAALTVSLVLFIFLIVATAIFLLYTFKTNRSETGSSS